MSQPGGGRECLCILWQDPEMYVPKYSTEESRPDSLARSQMSVVEARSWNYTEHKGLLKLAVATRRGRTPEELILWLLLRQSHAVWSFMLSCSEADGLLEMVCLYYTVYQHELAVLFRALKTIISFQGVPSKLPAQLVCFAEIILVCWRKFPGRKGFSLWISKICFDVWDMHLLFWPDKPNVVLGPVQYRGAFFLMVAWLQLTHCVRCESLQVSTYVWLIV